MYRLQRKTTSPNWSTRNKTSKPTPVGQKQGPVATTRCSWVLRGANAWKNCCNRALIKWVSSLSDFNAAAFKKSLHEKKNERKSNNDWTCNCKNEQRDGRSSANGGNTSMLDARIKAIVYDKGSILASASFDNNLNVEEKGTSKPLSAKLTNYQHHIKTVGHNH